MMAEAHPKGREVVDEMEAIHIKMKEYLYLLFVITTDHHINTTL